MNSFEIHKEIVVRSPINKVFSALTSSEEIPKYFPLKSVESDWLEGSEVLYKGEANGAPFTDYGVIEEISAPTTYRYRYWSDNHGTQRSQDNYLIIEYKLEIISEGTKVSVTQSNIKSKAMYEMMNNQVWGYLMDALKDYMENRT